MFNQFTETFSVQQLADMVQSTAGEQGIDVQIDHLPNPRIEKEEHYYNAKNTHLKDLGLQPNLLSSALIADMTERIAKSKERIERSVIMPRVKWRMNGGETAS